MSKSIRDLVSEAERAKNDWLEDVLAGLLINGVAKEDIEVQTHPNWRWVVAVRGEPKYEFKHTFITDG